MEALKLILVNVRSSCSVDNDNLYLFVTTKSASGHADSWTSVRDTCIRAGVSYPERMTATKMRHRASTYYSLLDVPENERKAFYTHMGHSQEINEMVYQCPTSVVEITKVGRYLEDLDNGCLRKTSTGYYHSMQCWAHLCDIYIANLTTETARISGTDICKSMSLIVQFLWVVKICKLLWQNKFSATLHGLESTTRRQF